MAAASQAAGPGPPVLVLVGPTAAGKTELALAVAAARGDVEVVAVDAFTLYRGMDIGTAKPSAADRAAVRHHMVDVLAPTEPADVAWFQGAARAAVADVRRRGRAPLLVGGSGLYLRAVVDDLRFPPTDADVRAGLLARWGDDPAGAHAEVARHDPTAAERIEPGNLRRSVRALEVLQLTGQPFSSFATAGHASVYDRLHLVCLDPDRDAHRAAVHTRAEAMVAAGLVDELRGLRALHGELSTTAAQGIGYAEAGAVLDGELPVDQLAPAIARRTWRYARRQRGWFARDPRCTPATPRGDVVDVLAGVD